MLIVVHKKGYGIFKMIETNKIYNIDCLEGMKNMEDNSVDLIITD